MSTRDLILDTAEQLFAEHGFSRTSMRMITKDAGVNLASVNYHFGSKDDLINEVFVRFLDPLTKALMQSLDDLETELKGESASTDAVLKTLADGILRADTTLQNRAMVFVRLLGLSFSEPHHGQLRRFLMERYQQILARYGLVLRQALPQLSMSELFWRLHFMLGAAGFTLAGLTGLQKIANRDFKDKQNVESQITHLVHFLAYGMKAPPLAVSGSTQTH